MGWLFFLCLLVVIFLSGCATGPQGGNTDQAEQELMKMFKVIEESNSADTPTSFTIDRTKHQINAFADESHHQIVITQGFVDHFQKHDLTRDMVFMILTHEFGHLSSGAKAFPGSKDEEQYCDYYGLLLMDEMNHEGQHINIREAIKWFISPLCPRDGGSSHPDSDVRYRYLTERLDYWAAHEGQVEQG